MLILNMFQVYFQPRLSSAYCFLFLISCIYRAIHNSMSNFSKFKAKRWIEQIIDGCIVSPDGLSKPLPWYHRLSRYLPFVYPLVKRSQTRRSEGDLRDPPLNYIFIGRFVTNKSGKANYLGHILSDIRGMTYLTVQHCISAEFYLVK